MIFYYIQSNEILRIINEIKCIFSLVKYKFYIFTSENIKHIFTTLSSEKYKIWIFFLIYINVFITRDENFYGIH